MPTPPLTADELDPNIDWVASRPGTGCPNPISQVVGNPIPTASMPNTSTQTAAGIDPVAWKRLIVNELTIAATNPPGGTSGAAYGPFTFVVSGGAAPYTWSVSAGSLGTGLTLNASTGVLSGTPTGAGTRNFTVKVVDKTGQSATKVVALVIA